MQSKDLYELPSGSCKPRRSGPLEEASELRIQDSWNQKELSGGRCVNWALRNR